jgi:hypothetical protein
VGQYLKQFPSPLLADLLAGRWLPIVGAGMSRNAVVPPGKQMPLWDDLGRELARDLQDYPYVGALDAISAYARDPEAVEVERPPGRSKLLRDCGPSNASSCGAQMLRRMAVCTRTSP